MRDPFWCEECEGEGVLFSSYGRRRECRACNGYGERPCFVCGERPNFDITEREGVALCSEACVIEYADPGTPRPCECGGYDPACEEAEGKPEVRNLKVTVRPPKN